MSDAKLFGKCKSQELRVELDQAKKKLKPQAKVKIVLKKAISNIILHNNELAHLLEDVTALMVIDDFEVRSLCSQFISHYALLDPSRASGALKFYERFGDDQNANLRALAVKTVALVNLKDWVLLALPMLKRLLLDLAPHVRTSAAFAVARLYQHDEERATKAGLINDLNELLYDENQVVVANALAALNSITESNKSLQLTIDKNHSVALVNGLSSANEWRSVYLLDALMSFVPQNSKDALSLIEIVLSCLSHSNSAVVLNAIKVIVYLSNYVERPEVVVPGMAKRIGSALVSLLSRPPEIQFLVLRNVILLLLGKRYLLEVDVEQFFWRFDDPIYVRDTKLEIIYLLADEYNVGVVFRELEEYATEIDANMARKAIRAFGNLAIKLEVTAQQSVDTLIDLLSDNVPHIVQECIIVLKNVLRKYPKRFDYAIAPAVRTYEIIEERDAKASICWIVGQYAEQIPEAQKIINSFVLSFNESPLEVQYVVLTAVVKYYIKFPSQGEGPLLKVLKKATEVSDNPDVRDRGFFYWRMITNPDNAGTDGDFQIRTKEIVIDPEPLISSENENIDPNILEELELNIGSLVSVYLKSVEHVFRLAKRKLLPYSPALQPRRKNETPRPSSRPSVREHNQKASAYRDHSIKPLPPVQRKGSEASSLASSHAPSRGSSVTDKGRISLGKRLGRKATRLVKKS